MADIFSSPVTLIDTVNGKLTVNENTLYQLEQLNGSLVIVAIAGLYRTGKSYLMNRLAGTSSGFALGNAIESKTKGIWIWVTKHPKKSDSFLVLLDTEGLGDVYKGDQNHDNWIFCLATLLSSVLCYNAKGAIDDDALKKVNFITEMSKHIRSRSDDNSDVDFDLFFPHFVFVLRDFHLDLIKNGKEMSPDEYLEDCLALKLEKDKKDKDFNYPRKCIRKYFKKRRCFVFDFPVMSSKKMKQLETLKNDQLSEDFLEQTDIFCNYVFNNAQVKKLENGQSINGRMWTTLVRSYVKTITEGKVPCVENAVTAMAEIENRRVNEECLAMYRQMIEKSIKFPTVNEKILSDHHFNCMKKVLSVFMTKAVFDKDNTFQRVLNERLQEIYNEYIRFNEDRSRAKCREYLLELQSPYTTKLANGGYTMSGGYTVYQADMTLVKDEYNARTDLGVKKDEVFLEFLQEKWQEGQQILAADTTVTEKEHQAEAERMRAIEAEKQRLAAQEALEKSKQEAEEREKALRENISQLEQKMTEELQNERKHHQEVLEERLAENKRLLEEGFNREADAMKQQIEQLNARIREAGKRKKKRCVIM